ncbi:MAG TPA: MarR family transcriptional regulator [Chloroflexia bacterium]|nr:MarR family transcriptional regulator [Chloroflexia bacterium]
MKSADNLKIPFLELKKGLKENHEWAADAPLPMSVRLFRTSHLLKNWFGERVKVSNSQMRVLFEALEPEGVCQGTISKNHDIDPAAVTRTVQTMERDGLVSRKTNPADNRQVRVYITEKGRNLIEGMPDRIANLERELLHDWTDDEILQLYHLLEKLERSLD